MEIPEDIQALVDQLGEALVEALVNDPRSRQLAGQLQEKGYDLALAIEATVALTLRRKEREDQGGAEEEDFSEDDKAFLRKFKISLE